MATDFIHGVQKSVLSGTACLTIAPPDGHEVELEKLVALHSVDQFRLIDGRIGENLLPIHGPIDLSYFAYNQDFRVGKITPDEPLRLYVEPVHGGHKSSVNLVVKGTMKEWTSRKANVDEQRSIGLFDINHFYSWLNENKPMFEVKKRLDLVLEVLEVYRSWDGKTPLNEIFKHLMVQQQSTALQQGQQVHQQWESHLRSVQGQQQETAKRTDEWLRKIHQPKSR